MLYVEPERWTITIGYTYSVIPNFYFKQKHPVLHVRFVWAAVYVPWRPGSPLSSEEPSCSTPSLESDGEFVPLLAVCTSLSDHLLFVEFIDLSRHLLQQIVTRNLIPLSSRARELHLSIYLICLIYLTYLIFYIINWQMSPQYNYRKLFFSTFTEEMFVFFLFHFLVNQGHIVWFNCVMYVD